MTDMITITDIIMTDEARISSIKLGEALGYKTSDEMNRAIKRNLDELSSYGILRQTDGVLTGKAGQPQKDYMLNESQALLIGALSRTDAAKQVRKAMIHAFIELKRLKQIERQVQFSDLDTRVKAIERGRNHGDQLHDLGVLKARMHATIDECRHSSDLSLYEELLRKFPGYVVPDIETLSGMRKRAMEARAALD